MEALGFRSGTNGSTIDKNAYVMCVLTQFHRHLKRRDIYADASERWRDPRAQLLTGDAWQAAKESALTDLGLPEDPNELLAEHSRLLDMALRDVGAQLSAGTTDATVGEDGRLHVAASRQFLNHRRSWTCANEPRRCCLGSTYRKSSWR